MLLTSAQFIYVNDNRQKVDIRVGLSAARYLLTGYVNEMQVYNGLATAYRGWMFTLPTFDEKNMAGLVKCLSEDYEKLVDEGGFA